MKEYKSKLDFFETERGIKFVKDTFQKKLTEKLSLQRVTAPRFLKVGTGLQDDLAGTQEPVGFKMRMTGDHVEIVHSLAKWKRYALGKYGFQEGRGLYTDMDAIRKDEELSDIHSIYVDQWDWEKIISKQDRTVDYLKSVVKKIYDALVETESIVESEFPKLKAQLPRKIKFVHTEDLEDMYPKLTPKQREYEITKKLGAVFLIGIGHPLKSGRPHDSRAADYDDWITETVDGKHGLCGDILIWDPIREDTLELSSMGIRVDKDSLIKQLEMMKQEDKTKLPFQRGIIEEKIPQTIGGGIGQSRICMVLLQKAHIGEVQSSVWPESVETRLRRKGIVLL